MAVGISSTTVVSGMTMNCRGRFEVHADVCKREHETMECSGLLDLLFVGVVGMAIGLFLGRDWGWNGHRTSVRKIMDQLPNCSVYKAYFVDL